MKEAAQAALLNGGQPFLSTAYSVVNNMFFTGLELPYSAGVLYHDPKNDGTYPKNFVKPPPFNNCQAFLTLNNKTLNPKNYKDKTGYSWFWELLTGGGNDSGNIYPWQNLPVAGTSGVACKDTTGASANDSLPSYIEKYFTVGGAVAGSFVDYYYLNRFGAPDFNYYCQTTDNVDVQPLCMALSKQADKSPKGFVVHNPNNKDITVQFYRVSDGSVLNLDGKGKTQITAGAYSDVYLDNVQ